jgi:hypothetical protein
MSSKLNKLISSWNKGTVVTYKHLSHNGYESSLLNSYIKSGWIESYGTGAYCLKNDHIEWTGALSSIQNQLSSSFIPGGRTALELHGRGHFIRNSNTVFIYGPQYEYLPKWFTGKTWDNNKLKIIKSKLFPENFDKGIQTIQVKEYSLKVSMIERALFELTYNIPDMISFEEAGYLFESMLDLNPELVQTLLESCNYIKVKRLFLYFADLKKLPCLEKVSLKNVDLGKGKRVIAKNGKYDSKYKITVPYDIDQEEESSEDYFEDESEI